MNTKMRGVPRKEFYFIDFGELLSQFMVDEEDESIEPIQMIQPMQRIPMNQGDQFKQYP